MTTNANDKDLKAKLYKTIQTAKCKKKRRFASENTAKLAGSALKRLSSYKCRYCEYWHLTSTGPPKD